MRSLLTSPRRDFEVIVRDNCSTDDTLEQLRGIEDDRLKIHKAPQNQGTLTFFEVSKLASGMIVTWLSDEDNFQFSELDFVLECFRQDPDCNVMLGGIIVGASAREVRFPEAVVSDTVQAHVIALSFSGCGGLFIRSSALREAHSFKVLSLDDAYALWNYYPVGFFASRCLARSLRTTSRVVVVQTRFANTTNNWSEVSPRRNARVPHYYPESVFDRLASNIVNIWSKPLPFTDKLRIARRLTGLFRLQTASYSDPAMHQLLRENYPEATVQAYLRYIGKLRLNDRGGRLVWAMRKIFLSLPLRVLQTRMHWTQLTQGP